MGRIIAKIKHPKTGHDVYFEWSTIVDGPVTYGMTLEEFKAYYKDEYGRHGMESLPDQLIKVDLHGHNSRFYKTVEDLLSTTQQNWPVEKVVKAIILKKGL